MTAPNKTAKQNLRMRIPCCCPIVPIMPAFAVLVMAGLDGGERERERERERDASRCRRPSLASVDLTTHERDGALIDLSGIPCLDGCEVGLSRLGSCPRAPAVRL